jgi:putative FmdB family regulatory protein
MPLYEYVCRHCNTQSELLVQAARQPECPQCGSSKLTKLLSVVAAPNRAGIGPAPGPSAGPCGPSCGCHPRG